MSLVFINGNTARCRDCGYYEYTGKLHAADPHDGRCTNAKHVKTHGGGTGRVKGTQRTCFDAEGKPEEQTSIWDDRPDWCPLVPVPDKL